MARKKKRKTWCGSSVASGKFLNSPALGFSICIMESLPTQGHSVGSPWFRGCHGQPTSPPSSLDLDLHQSLLEGRESWPTTQGRNGFPPLDCVWTALSGERERRPRSPCQGVVSWAVTQECGRRQNQRPSGKGAPACPPKECTAGRLGPLP